MRSFSFGQNPYRQLLTSKIFLLLFVLVGIYLCLFIRQQFTSLSPKELDSSSLIKNSKNKESLPTRVRFEQRTFSWPKKKDSISFPHIHISIPYDCLIYGDALQALLNSIINSTYRSQQSSLFFHLLVIPSEISPAEGFILEASRLFPNQGWELNIWWGWELLINQFLVYNDPRKTDPHNLARIYLPHLMGPHVEKIISLDADLLFNANVGLLWKQADVREKALAVILDSDKRPLSRYLSLNGTNQTAILTAAPSVKQFLKTYDKMEPVFSAGIFVANLTTWRTMDAPRLIEEWGRFNSKNNVFRHGLKKNLLNLVFYKNYWKLGKEWESGLCSATGEEPWEKRVIHFAGKKSKPWLPAKASRECSKESRKRWEEAFYLYKWSLPEGLCVSDEVSRGLNLFPSSKNQKIESFLNLYLEKKSSMSK